MLINESIKQHKDFIVTMSPVLGLVHHVQMFVLLDPNLYIMPLYIQVLVRTIMKHKYAIIIFKLDIEPHFDYIFYFQTFDRYKCARLVMECLCQFDETSMNRMSVAICSILAAKVCVFVNILLMHVCFDVYL